MSKDLSNITEEEVNINLKKREFMGKMGKYAVVGAGMATLMTPTTSTANCYGRSRHGYNGLKAKISTEKRASIRQKRAKIRAAMAQRRAEIRAKIRAKINSKKHG